jgi:hypothetical protein
MHYQRATRGKRHIRPNILKFTYLGEKAMFAVKQGRIQRGGGGGGWSPPTPCTPLELPWASQEISAIKEEEEVENE